MSRLNLAGYRMEKAKEILDDAEYVFQKSRFMVSVNRSYYAMFTAARALLALEEKDSSKHSGVISLFNQWIVKPGKFSKNISRFLVKAKALREDADYGDFVKITKEDGRIQLERAKKFYGEAKKRLDDMEKIDEKGINK